MKILLDQRLDPLYESVMEATEEAILNSLCMATPMAGVDGHEVPALPLDEVRRFVDATRPIFATVNKTPADAAVPAGKEPEPDVDDDDE
jgi:D-aminopeptidase